MLPGSPGPSGRRIDADDRSFSVRPVPGDGDCLFRAVLDSMAAQHPGRRAPGSATALQGMRGRLADWYADSADAADLRALHASQDPLEALVADLFPHLDDLQDLLGLSTAPRLTEEQRDRIARRTHRNSARPTCAPSQPTSGNASCCPAFRPRPSRNSCLPPPPTPGRRIRPAPGD